MLMLDRFKIAVKDWLRGEKTPRSPEWPRVRREWLKLHPQCAACGTTRAVEVHHMVPFHIDRSKELDFSNFITLCESVIASEHHFAVGHFRNWKNYNPNVIADAAKMLASHKA